MEDKEGDPRSLSRATTIPESKFMDRLQNILISLNMTFEAARAGEAGQELYLLSKAAKENPSPLHSEDSGHSGNSRNDDKRFTS